MQHCSLKYPRTIIHVVPSKHGWRKAHYVNHRRYLQVVWRLPMLCRGLLHPNLALHIHGVFLFCCWHADLGGKHPCTSILKLKSCPLPATLARTTAIGQVRYCTARSRDGGLVSRRDGATAWAGSGPPAHRGAASSLPNVERPILLCKPYHGLRAGRVLAVARGRASRDWGR